MRHVNENYFIFRFLKDYLDTFDVYVGKAPKYKVWLVDFNVWGEKTVPLLFEWEELESEKIAENLSQKLYDKVEGIDFRIVENQESTRSDGLSQFKVPLVSDIVFVSVVKIFALGTCWRD